MPTPDGRIHSENLCSQAVVERILGDEAVTSVKIYNTIQSDNFVTGTSGWQIRRDTGSCEFQDGTFRGSLNADDISAGTMAASYLGAGTIGVHVIKLSNSSSSRIESNDGTSLIIRGDGNFTATAGSLSGLSIDGTLTMGSGGEIITDSSTTRLEIRNDDDNPETGHPSILAYELGTLSGKIRLDTTLDVLRITSHNAYDISIVSAADAALAADDGNTLTLGVLTAADALNTGMVVDDDSVDIYVSTSNVADFDGTAFQTTTASGYYLKHAAGTAAAPTYSFNGDTDTGMYRDGANSIGWATSGTERLQLDDNYLNAAAAATGAAAIYVAGAGAAATPAFAFAGDTNTGFYRVTTDELGIACGGTRTWKITRSSGVSYIYGQEDNDWMQYDATNEQWAWYITSNLEMLLGGTGFKVSNVYNTDQAGGSTVYADSDGLLHINTSTLRHKQNVEPAPQLADIQLTPITFTKHGHQDISFAAEWLADQDDRLAIYEPDGKVLDFRDRAVLAILAAKINRLEEHCDLAT